MCRVAPAPVWVFYCCLLILTSFGFAEENNAKPPESNEAIFWANVHPYAYYLLNGTYDPADIESGVASVNVTKFKLNHKSNELSGKETYNDEGWIGFRTEENDGRLNFKYRIYKKLTIPNYVIIEICFDGGGSSSFSRYLLIRRSGGNYYNFDGKIKRRDILSCHGNFGANPPSKNKIKEIEELIKQKKIGDIQ